MVSKKFVFITGGNTGIGYEVVKALLQSPKPYHVFMGSRSVEKGQKAAQALKEQVPETASSVDVVQVDLSSDDSIESAFQTVQKSTGLLDVLVNNAGHALDNKEVGNKMTRRQIWHDTIDVNVAGTDIITQAFVPLLLRSTDPRLLFVSSQVGSLGILAKNYYPGIAPTAKGWPKPPPPAPLPNSDVVFMPPVTYRSSKTALNMLMLMYHYQLNPDGVKVWSVSPGFLATGLGDMKDLVKAIGAQDASLGGTLVRSVIEGERDADTGKNIEREGVVAF